MSDSVLVESRLPCGACGSSDARAVYDDCHSYCFSCQTTFRGEEEQFVPKVKGDWKPLTGDVRPLPSRRISAETCQKFGYRIATTGGRTVQVADYRDPSGTLVGQKLRFPNKEFSVLGKVTGTLFGQHLWRGRTTATPTDVTLRLVITEGEIDALSYAEATGCAWPVVSIPNGAAGAAKAISHNIEWVESFDQIILMFDTDDPGRKAAAEVADILSPGKAFVAELPLKDANEMLVAGRIKELTKAVWTAREVRPDGIINAADLWERIATTEVMGMPYPWQPLNDMLFGIRPGEIVTVVAGTGVGKSAFMRELAYHFGNTAFHKVGYVALEENVRRTALGILSIHVNKPLHLPGHGVDEGGMHDAFGATLGTGRYYLYDHFGSLDGETLFRKLRYMVKGCGCDILILDHLSIIVSGMDLEGDERRAIDHIMTRLRSFTEETGAALLLVSHLKRPEGKGHENGAETTLAQLRGSAAIAQLSDAVIGLERDQQAEDSGARNRTTVRVLKNRYSGITGPAMTLLYSHETGRLSIQTDSDLFDEGPNDF